MIVHENIVQGSQEWKDLRKKHLTASIAPAMMNDGYTTRNDAISEWLGHTSRVISRRLQTIFDDGHLKEALARPVAEAAFLESFFPVVGSIVIEGLPLLASFDGITGDKRIVWEHKHTSKQFDEIPAIYYWQLEQQILIAGAEKAILTITDRATNEIRHCEYFSVPERRAALLAGWRQWKDDCVTFKPAPKKEVSIANEQKDFPLIECRVEGSLVVSNLGEYIPMIKKLADEQMSIVLETDQNFADKEAFNKKVKEGRANLKNEAKQVETQFASLAEFNGFVKDADSILQKLQAHGEKQVKESKELKKRELIFNASDAILKHIYAANKALGQEYIVHTIGDWALVLKGKRNFESMQNALDSEVANIKIEVNAQADLIRKNLNILDDLGKDYSHLFADKSELVSKNSDDLANLVKTRVADYKAKEKEKLIAQREEIRIEEEKKARATITKEVNTPPAAKQPVEEKVEENWENHAAKPIQRYIEAVYSEKGDGCNLYLDGTKVGYIESHAVDEGDIVIRFSPTS